MSIDVSLRVAIFWVATILCIIAEAAILRSMLRGSRPGAGRADAAGANVPRGRPVMEVLWAVVPAIGLVFVLVMTRNAIR